VKERAAYPSKLVALFLGVTAVALLSHSPVTVLQAAESNFKPVIEERVVRVVDESTGRTVGEITRPAGVVREVFALNNGTVLAISQKDFTQFFDLKSRKQIRNLDKRIYTFDRSGNSAIAYTSDHDLVLVSYPSFRERIIASAQHGGPSAVLFSPESEYVAVQFCNRYPLSDAEYPNPVLEKTLYWVKLYDLENREQVTEVKDFFLGSFSADSRFYTTGDGRKLNLGTRKFQ
jgi:hypothetical protein